MEQDRWYEVAAPDGSPVFCLMIGYGRAMVRPMLIVGAGATWAVSAGCSKRSGVSLTIEHAKRQARSAAMLLHVQERARLRTLN